MKKFGTLILACSSVLVMVSPVRTVSAAGNSDKVVICHRTHSVTNPYVRITVAQRSVGNGNGKHGGNSHDQWSNVLFSSKPVPNVYNSAITYSPAPEKKWGDIISATDVSGNALTGNALVVAGLNNSGIGALIFNGTGSHANKCRSMTAREFYDIETTEGGQTAADVLADMNEADSDEWAAALSSCGGSFTGCAASTLGASVPATTTTTTTAAPTTTVAATRKLRGTLWIDADRNGKLGSTEKVLANYPVTVRAGSGNSSTQTYNVTTDASGNYEIADLPAGNWVVTPAALPNSNYEKVFDTDSGTASPDWVVTASVPATGVATADFATTLTAAAVAAGAPDILGSTPAATPASTTGTSSSGSGAVSKGSLKGTLWIDANRNGVKDAGEKILAGYKLTITPGAGNASPRTYTAVTGSAGNYRVSSLRVGKWVITASPLPGTNYEGVFDTDSDKSSVNWTVTLTVKKSSTARADFGAALTKKAVAAGVADDLGAEAVLPETGSRTMILLIWSAALLMACGSSMLRRSRRQLL